MQEVEHKNVVVRPKPSTPSSSGNKQDRSYVREEYLEVRPGVLVRDCGDIGTSCIEIK